MKNRFLALLTTLCLLLSFAPAALAAGDTASVTTREELKTALENPAVSTISIESDITMGDAYWTPVVTDRPLTIDGNNHTISGLKVNEGIVKPSGSGEAGDGGSCDYYAGFIGNNTSALTIQNLTFADAEVDINPLTVNQSSTGSSILAVVCANNAGGALIYNNVNVDQSTVRGYTKVGVLHGFTQSGTFTANHCSVTNSKVVLEADGKDPEACLSGIIVGYDGNNLAKTTGIKLSGNSCEIADTVRWDSDSTYDANTGVTSVFGYGANYGLTCETYTHGAYGVDAVLFAAEVNGYQYETVEAAFAAAQSGGTVKLLRPCTDLTNVTIDNNKKLTLNLNGKDIAFAADNGFIVRGGALDLTGSGTVSSSYGSRYLPTIYAYGSSADQADYSVVTVGKDVTVKNDGSYALAIGHSENKAYGAKVIVEGRVESTYGFTVTGNATATNGNLPELTVTKTGEMICTGGSSLYAAGYAKYYIAGKLSGKEFGIEIRAGELTVEEGAEISASSDFSDPAPNGNGSTVFGAALAVSQHTTNLPIAVKINGGTFTATGTGGHAIYEIDTVKDEAPENVAKDVRISVAGGSFSGGVFSTNEKLFISAGYFTSDVSDYCVSGTACSENADGNSGAYPYKVSEAGLPGETVNKVDTTTATGDTDAKVEVSGLSAENQQAATAVAESVVPATEGNTLASAITQDVQAGEKEAAIRQLAAAGIITVNDEGAITSNGADAIVTVVQETYLDVTVTAFANSAENKSFTLDIEPKYNLKATIDPDSMTEDNTVTLAEAQPLAVPEGSAVDITIPLPDGFAAADDTVFVTHTKANGRVFKTECTVTQTDAGLSILFTNRNGFSTFTVSLPAAQIGSTNYATLQDAVNAVQNGETIMLLNSVTETVTVSRTVSFTLDLNEKTFNGFTTGSYTTASASNPPAGEGGLFSFVYSAPSHSSSQTYAVVTPSTVAHGAVTVRPARAEKGNTVTLLLTPSEGYKLDELSVTDKNGDQISVEDKGDGKYTFTMPASKVTVAVSFSKLPDPVTDCPQGSACPAVAFDDISSGAWYHDGVHFCVAENLMNGVSASRFAPDANLSRAMLVTVLYRMEGSPEVGAPAFTDVPAGLWYSDAVAWAAENGIVNGVGDNRFAPDRDISRQDMAATLYRYAKYKGYDMTKLADLIAYNDAGNIAPYAREAVQWCVAGGIISGKPGDLLDPSGSATRAEVASVLMRCCMNIKK